MSSTENPLPIIRNLGSVLPVLVVLGRHKTDMVGKVIRICYRLKLTVVLIEVVLGKLLIKSKCNKLQNFWSGVD